MRTATGVLLLVAAASLVAGCNRSDDGSDDDAAPTISAEIASFDLAAGRDQRFIVGLIGDNNQLLAYGKVTLRFAYAGTREQPIRRAQAGPPVEATYLPIAGQPVDPTKTGPRPVNPSEARGVYGAEPVRFDQAGIWGVVAEGTIAGKRFTVQDAFEVKTEPQVVAIGQPAPRTQNPLPGAPTLPATAIDSRADAGTVPDPELHSTTIADALAAGRPVTVVVSTPVYCVSRFCGPITDSVQQLAQQAGDRMAFVHLEVWQDFENKVVNTATQEWILPRDGSNAGEPWVFVVGSDGTVLARFDNVATDAGLRQAVQSTRG
ncbi:MAG: hypothetical protein ACRDZ1_08730 [Acidimicrobiia bacterium]